jgi:hypothetical protein
MVIFIIPVAAPQLEQLKKAFSATQASCRNLEPGTLCLPPASGIPGLIVMSLAPELLPSTFSLRPRPAAVYTAF